MKLAGLEFEFGPAIARRCAVLLAILVAVCIAVLYLSDLLQNKQQIVTALKDATTTGPLNKIAHVPYGTWMSNFSECIGLSVSVNETEGGLLSVLQSKAILWQPPTEICQSLSNHLAGEEVSWFTYSRYWHGYRIVNQAVLSFYSFETLQAFCLAGLMLSLAIWAFAQAQVSGIGIAIASAIALLVCTDLAPSYLVPTHAVSLTSLLLLSAGVAFMSKSMDFARLLPFCFIAGAIYNFFDFLYNPDLLIFLIGATVALNAVGQFEDWRKLAARVFEAQLMVLVGYLAMWMAKWTITTILLLDFFPVQDIGRWLPGGSGSYIPFLSIWRLSEVSLAIGQNSYVLPALVSVGIVCGALLYRSRCYPALWAPLLPILLPLIVLEAKASHTIAHGTFTFRTIAIAAAIITINLLFSAWTQAKTTAHTK